MADQEKKQVQLPRARIGGLQKGPVEDLLRRIARDFAQLENENKRLWAALEGLGDFDQPGPSGQAAGADEPSSATSPNGHEAPDRTVQVARPRSLESRRWAHPPSPEWRQETDGLATAVLALAQEAADELRESTRQQCELMIRKTRHHAEQLGQDLERSRARTAAELAELQALRRELREQMRSSLEALLRSFVAERSGELPALSWHDPANLLGLPEQGGSRKKRKKSKS